MSDEALAAHEAQDLEELSPEYTAALLEIINANKNDFCDYPTGWAVQLLGLTHFSPQCSAVQTHDALMCDCDALVARWHRGMLLAGRQPDY
jgi:hypothetical protein